MPAKKAKPKRPALRTVLAESVVRSVSGSATLIEIPTKLAVKLFGEDLRDAGGTRVIEAVEDELAELGKRRPDIPGSGIAAIARAMALELEDPYNSATSKSMCSRQLREAIEYLTHLAPDRREDDRLDELAKRRERRISGRATT